MFMRKLWLNVNPGIDPVADLMFHFPQVFSQTRSFKPHCIAPIHDFCGASTQEVPKYLKGRHKCTKEDMIHLGGLLFRIQVDSDRSRFVEIPQMLKDLVPADQIHIMPPEEWKKVQI